MNNRIRRIKRESPYILFLIPSAIIILVFLYYPLVKGIPIAFTDWDGLRTESNFVGLDNFKRIFTDPNIGRDLKNTFLFTILEIIGCNVMGLIMALTLKKTTHFNNTLRTLFFMPYVISLILAAYIMQNYIYEVTNMLGITNPFSRPSTVIPGLSLVAIWRDSGYCMIIYVAALMGIDTSVYEAALLDGASNFKRFFKITLPLIVPAITSNVTLLLSWGLKLYDYSMTIVRGDASESINVYVYRLIFKSSRAGYGMAVALLWLVVIFILTNTVASLLRKQEVEI